MIPISKLKAELTAKIKYKQKREFEGQQSHSLAYLVQLSLLQIVLPPSPLTDFTAPKLKFTFFLSQILFLQFYNNNVLQML